MDELLTYSFPPAYEFPPDSEIYNIHLPSDVLIKKIQLYLPSMQRELDAEWVESLTEKIKEAFVEKGFVDIGTIHIGIYDNTFHLIDGQHRYVVLNELFKCRIIIPVHVKLYDLKKEQDLSELFAKINGSKPSKIYQSTQTQIIINTFRKYMTEEYSEYFVKTDRPKKPNLNLQQTIDKMMEKDILGKLNITHPNTLIEYVEELNTYYRRTTFETWNSWKVKDVDVLLCYHKRPIRHLYLGVFRNFEWVDRIIASKQNEQSYSLMNHVSLNFRITISKKKRRSVWDKRNISVGEGKCFVCKQTDDYDYDTFECGHIVACYWGGDTTLDNLEPICKKCNLDMGVQNLLEYKDTHYPMVS